MSHNLFLHSALVHVSPWHLVITPLDCINYLSRLVVLATLSVTSVKQSSTIWLNRRLPWRSPCSSTLLS